MRAAALAVPVLAGPAAAQGDVPAFVRAIEAQPGVTVTHGGGGTPSTEWRRAGVSDRLERRAEGDVLVGDDESGAGAVLCAWMIDDAVRAALAACPADRFPALRADLDRDVPAIERFIVANSVSPTTIEALRAEAAARSARERAASPRAGSPACTAEAAGGLVGALDGMGPERHRAALAGPQPLPVTAALRFRSDSRR